MIPVSDALSTSVAFTGHRTCDHSAVEPLRRTVTDLYASGSRAFLCGMAVGFDLAAAEAVLACRAECPELQLICVIPFAGQESRFSATDRDRYARVVAAADRVLTLSPSYYAGCYARRNDYLVDHASTLVAWYDGSPGGTHYTVRRALRRALRFINLCPASRSQQIASSPELF